MSTEVPNAAASNADFEFAALNEAKNYRAALIREFQAWLTGDVIEIGAGIGQMTTHLRELSGIRRLIAVEPDPKLAGQHREAHPGHELYEGTISDVPPAEGWNAIFSVNVLEHIEADAAELARYASLLRPRCGAFCVLVPARPEIYAPIDGDFGHFRRYTRPELSGKLEQAGFEVERISYFNFVGYFAWWLNFCVFAKRTFEIEKVRLYDRRIFPVVNWLERNVARPPIGQSLVAVARAR